MNLGENLRKIRKDNNLSQEDLADLLKVSRQSVSKWESGIAYPEMDKIAWFSLEDAKRYINKSQLFFINRLEKMLKTKNKL